MISVVVGERYSAGHTGCRKFPLPVQVLHVNPVFPRVTIRDAVGIRTIGLQAMCHCIACGCIVLVGKNRANENIKNSACIPAQSVVSCSYGGWQASEPPTAAANNGHAEKGKIVENQILTFVRDHKGVYSSFKLDGGGRGSVCITNKLFPGGVVPSTIEISGLVPAEETVKAASPDAEAKAAAAAAKAQAKADKAAEKAKAAAEKAEARVAKAQAAVEAAKARAAKAAAATAGTDVAGEGQPEL